MTSRASRIIRVEYPIDVRPGDFVEVEVGGLDVADMLVTHVDPWLEGEWIVARYDTGDDEPGEWEAHPRYGHITLVSSTRQPTSPPVERTVIGLWECRDPVTPAQAEEDRPFLPSAPSPYADNVVVPSGRTWRFKR